MKIVNAITILQGIIKLPTIQDFWSESEMFNFTFVRKLMNRDRFLAIYDSLHFTDCPDAYSAGDRLYKTLC